MRLHCRALTCPPWRPGRHRLVSGGAIAARQCLWQDTQHRAGHISCFGAPLLLLLLLRLLLLLLRLLRPLRLLLRDDRYGWESTTDPTETTGSGYADSGVLARRRSSTEQRGATLPERQQENYRDAADRVFGGAGFGTRRRRGNGQQGGRMGPTGSRRQRNGRAANLARGPATRRAES